MPPEVEFATVRADPALPIVPEPVTPVFALRDVLSPPSNVPLTVAVPFAAVAAASFFAVTAPVTVTLSSAASVTLAVPEALPAWTVFDAATVMSPSTVATVMSPAVAVTSPSVMPFLSFNVTDAPVASTVPWKSLFAPLSVMSPAAVALISPATVKSPPD